MVVVGGGVSLEDNLGYESGALMNGINDFIGRDTRDDLSLSIM